MAAYLIAVNPKDSLLSERVVGFCDVQIVLSVATFELFLRIRPLGHRLPNGVRSGMVHPRKTSQFNFQYLGPT